MSNENDMKLECAFSLAEMMVVMLIMSIVLAAMAPVITTRIKADDAIRTAGIIGGNDENNPWQWTENSDTDAYSQADRNMIGQKKLGADDGDAKLIINVSGDINTDHILFKRDNADESLGLGEGILGRIHLGTNKSFLFGSLADGTVLSDESIGIGYKVTAGGTPESINNIAIGINTISRGEESLAIGNNTSVIAKNSLAIGNGAVAGGTQIKSGAETKLGNATAIGLNAKAYGSTTVAIGASAEAGDPTNATQCSNSVAIGYAAKATKEQSLAIMRMAEASGTSSIAIGKNALASNTNAIAIGAADNEVKDKETGEILYWNRTTASGISSIAIGTSAQVVANTSIAIGWMARTTAYRAIGIGPGVEVTGEKAIAIGSGESSDNEFGKPVVRDNTQAIGNLSIAIGYKAIGDGAYGIAIGTTTSAGESAIAIGRSTQASAGSIAMGTSSKASNLRSISIGVDSAAEGRYCVNIGSDAKTPESYAVALGPHANAKGNYSTALGMRSGANATSAISIGSYAGASGENSIAIGSAAYNSANGTLTYEVKATGSNSVAIGSQAQATHDWDFILGSANHNVKIPGTLTVKGANVTSDKRLKYIKGENKNGLDAVRKMKVYNFTFKKDQNKEPRVGVIAQELQKILPDAVKKGSDGFLTIRIDDIIYTLVNAVKELDRKVSELTQTLKQVQAEQKRINKRLDTLEQKSVH